MQQSNLRLRVNGNEIDRLCVQRELVNGSPTGPFRLVIEDPNIGWIVLDDNRSLWDPALPQFVLEFFENGNWTRTTARTFLTVLESTGVIK